MPIDPSTPTERTAQALTRTPDRLITWLVSEGDTVPGFARLFWILAAFFGVATVVYVVWNLAYESQRLATDPSGGEGRTLIEWTGTVALGLVTVLAVLIAFYLRRVNAAQRGVLPEDREDAEIDDGDAEQGHFSPWSWWPLTLGGALALLFLGLAVGAWIAIIGAAIAVVAVVGWVYEYYRGAFGR